MKFLLTWRDVDNACTVLSYVHIGQHFTSAAPTMWSHEGKVARHRQVRVLEPITSQTRPSALRPCPKALCCSRKGAGSRRQRRGCPRLPLQELLREYVTRHRGGCRDWESRAGAIEKGRGGEVPLLLLEEEICCVLLTSE